MQEKVFRQILLAIQKAKKIVLIPHKKPDGDSLGAITAFSKYLSSINKNHTVFSFSPFPTQMKFLPNSKNITSDQKIWEDKNIDTVIVFDSSDLRHTGCEEYIKNLSTGKMVINIDHHYTNEFFGNLNLVMPKASSTTEVLYHFFNYNDIKIDGQIATSLLTGLVTDTDHFTNPATSAVSLFISSHLVNKGGNLNKIKSSILKNKTVTSLKLWGIVFSRLTKHPDFDIVYTYITQKDLQENNLNEEEVEGISNFLNNLKEGKASLILRETSDGKIKGSFRTSHDSVDVASYALALGGGGHKKAAGFTISGTLESAKTQVFETIARLNGKKQ